MEECDAPGFSQAVSIQESLCDVELPEFLSAPAPFELLDDIEVSGEAESDDEALDLLAELMAELVNELVASEFRDESQESSDFEDDDYEVPAEFQYDDYEVPAEFQYDDEESLKSSTGSSRHSAGHFFAAIPRNLLGEENARGEEQAGDHPAAAKNGNDNVPELPALSKKENAMEGAAPKRGVGLLALAVCLPFAL